ncbi:hypothetical protein B484DRAFT_425807, partial [Ochromonadaceae sp. CCMP2298]
MGKGKHLCSPATLLLALALLVWVAMTLVFFQSEGPRLRRSGGSDLNARTHSHSRNSSGDSGSGLQAGPAALAVPAAAPLPAAPAPALTIVSRLPGVAATSDVRGNLGPVGVVLQSPPGTNWLKDRCCVGTGTGRWQAASDMGGTALPGEHWVILDLGRDTGVARVVLDWEAAFANDYVIQGWEAEGGGAGG